MGCVQFAKLGKGVILYRSRHYIHDPLGLSSFKYILSAKVAILKFHGKVSPILLCEKEISETHFPWLVGTSGWNVSMQMLLLQQGQYLAHPVYVLEARGVDPRHPLALHLDWMKIVIMTRGALLDAFPLLFLVPLPQSYRHHIFLSRP